MKLVPTTLLPQEFQAMNSLQECNLQFLKSLVFGETEKTRQNYGLNKNEADFGEAAY